MRPRSLAVLIIVAAVVVATKKMDQHQAYQLTSRAGDVAVTQLVDGTLGVHVKMPKSVFK